MSDTPGYYTQGAIGTAGVEAEGLSSFPTNGDDVRGALFSQAMGENITSRAARQQNSGVAGFGQDALTPEAANESYGIEGRLTFTQPVTIPVARDLYEHHRAQAVRDDVVRRSGNSAGTGTGTALALGLVATLFDPVNVASAFIPFFGEARIAAAMGGAARGAVGRLTARGIEGAGAGFLGAAALEPAQYWLSQQDKDDYGMGNVLTNLAFGTLAGGFLHGGLGALGDRLTGRLPAWSPEAQAASRAPAVSPDMHEAALRQAAAASIEGRPVQAAAAMDFVAARQARTEIEQWLDAAARSERQADDAAAAMDGRTGGVAAARERLTRLRDEADALRGDVAEARGRLSDAGIDEPTKARLDEIDTELAGAIPRARRADLERERTMLAEGQDYAALAPGTSPLEAARSEAEIAGLEKALGRANSGLALAEAQMQRAMAARKATGRVFKHESAALSARKALTTELAARTLRKTAGRMGTRLEAGEAAEMASRVMRAKPEAAKQIVDDILNDLSKRAVHKPYAPDGGDLTPGAESAARVVADLHKTEAATQATLRDNLHNGADPAAVQAQRSTDQAAQMAPKVEGSAADQLAEIDAANKALQDYLARVDATAAAEAKAAGRAAPKPDPVLEQADEAAKMGDIEAERHEALGFCMMRRA